MPYAMATSKCPKFVSKAMAVVKTLVPLNTVPFPSKLAPTSVAMPSSPKPLLNAAVIESIIDHIVSRISVRFVLKPDAPRVRDKSRNCTSAVPNALAVKLMIRGETRMASPIAIPLRVYKRFKKPNSPCLDKSKYMSKPSATVGMPMRALKIPLIAHFPLKLYKPNSTAIGMLQRHAKSAPTPAT